MQMRVLACVCDVGCVFAIQMHASSSYSSVSDFPPALTQFVRPLILPALGQP